MLPIRPKNQKRHLARLIELKPPAGVRQYRASMKQVKESVQAMFKSAMPAIQSLINGATDFEGNLVLSQKQRVAKDAGEIIHRLFVGPDGRNAFAQDGVTALAAYPQILNTYYVRVTLEAIYAQRNWLQKNMPTDLFNWLARSRFDIRLSEAENPFLRRDGETDEEFMQRMSDLRVFHPNPLAELDPNRQWVPMHVWQDERGYQLSDRIWNTANDTRTLIDRLIIKAFNEGWGAVNLARELEQYLVSGSGGSSAFRLARTEIARAANQAAYVSAYLNPYVSKIDVARSSNGDARCDICKANATIGIGGGRTREPYSVHAAHIPPYHPNCVTPGQLVTTHRGKIPIESVIIGDYVLTHKGRFRRVINAWSRPYSGLVHDIKTGLSRVELTSEHPVLSSAGWINAESVKLGEQVLHASIGTQFDLVLGVSESHPTKPFKVDISDGIFFGLMPTTSIAFDSNFAFNKGKVNLVTPDAILSLVFNFGFIKSNHHRFFDRSGNTLTAILENFGTTSYQTRVANFFNGRDFGSNFGTFGRIIFPRGIKSRHGIPHSFAGDFGASPIVVRPLSNNSLAFRAHFKPKILHNFAEHAERDTKHFGAGICPVFLLIVEGIEDLFCWLGKFLLNSGKMLKSGCQSRVAGSAVLPFAEISANNTGAHSIRSFGSRISPTILAQAVDIISKARHATNQTRGFLFGELLFPASTAQPTKCAANNTATGTIALFGSHDNLLSLSFPEFSKGIPSGNGSVEQLAILPQAQLNYSTVERVLVREYEGLVYNMSVEEDESYVVDDMVVHNCMCHVRPVLDDNAAAVTRRLQAVMQDARVNSFPPPVTPANADAFTNMLLHRALGTLVGQVKGQLPLLGF